MGGTDNNRLANSVFDAATFSGDGPHDGGPTGSYAAPPPPPDLLAKIAHYTNPPDPQPSRPGGIEDLMLVTGADAVITRFEPIPEMLTGYGTTVNMGGESTDDSSAGFGDLADSPYFPRYGAAIVYSSAITRRTTK